MWDRRPRRADDEGAVLVLALVFMIITALVLLAVVNLSGDDLANTSSLVNEQSLEFRTAGAMNVAIEAVRYTSSSTLFQGGSCFKPSTSPVPVGSNSPPVYVDCSTVQNPSNSNVSREINFFACSTGNNCSSSNYTIAATVDFVDGPTCGSGSFDACGTTVSIKTWLVHNANS